MRRPTRVQSWYQASSDVSHAAPVSPHPLNLHPRPPSLPHSKRLQVPSIPWSGSLGNEGDDGPLQANLQEDGTIPLDIFNTAMVTTVEEAVDAAKRIGFPVMLKASEGGGGKGIRMNDNEEELRANFPQVEAEVPGSPMFMMQLCTGKSP